MSQGEGEADDRESRAVGAVDLPTSKPRQPSLARVRRELTEEDLSAPGVRRLLVGQIDELHQQLDEISVYRDRFHEADKTRAVLEQKLRVSVASDIAFGVCLTVGAAIVGLVPTVWDKGPLGPIFIALGLILMASGVFFRAKQYER